jgi:hypothetical protein
MKTLKSGEVAQSVVMTISPAKYYCRGEITKNRSLPKRIEACFERSDLNVALNLRMYEGSRKDI